MRLLVISSAPVLVENGFKTAYPPFVREMDIWLDQVDSTLLAAPGKYPFFLNTKAFKKQDFVLTKLSFFKFKGLKGSLLSFLIIPKVFIKLLAAIRKSEHIHLRCPGNISLLACIAQVFFPKKPKSVKYAGNWDPEAKQPWTYRLQKWILSNTFLSRNIKVLVYGDWPNQSNNIIPFFTASFSERERESVIKSFKQPYKFIFTGNLVEGKGIFEAIELIENLKNKGVISELDIYGDGVLEDSLRSYIQNKELQNFVKLKGRKSLEELKQAYREAHFVVLLSKSEGWPKAIAEGMWYGCIPVATPVSCVPWMLNYGERGILIRNVEKGKENKENRAVVLEEEVARITGLLKNPEKLKQMSFAAQEWSQQYTLETFEKAIQEVLHKKQPKSTANSLSTRTPQLTTEKREPLRILQLIDSLRPGGAERMAVNTANTLESHIKESFLCCTRQEGVLKEELKPEVGYLFLNKTFSVDPKAIIKLIRYIREHKIDIIHAHGTSWFLGVLMKFFNNIKLVWHDHYGESENLETRSIRLLKLFSGYFDGIISVNGILKTWAKNTLRTKSVIHLNNFIVEGEKEGPFSDLKGEVNSFKIICVGNIRPQKDHLNLLRAFEIAANSNQMISLHLVGEDPNTAYSKAVLQQISTSVVADRIFFYGTQKNIPKILEQANLGILSSRSEGMPLALLEYGMATLPVVCTNVGQCPQVIGSAGILVNPHNPKQLAEAILSYAENNQLCLDKGQALKNSVSTQFGENSYRLDLLKFYKRT